jgi:hypothetical protein
MYNTLTVNFPNLKKCVFIIVDRTKINKQTMIKVFYTRINARMYTYDHGLLPVANDLTGIQNALVKCLFILNLSWMHYWLSTLTEKNIKE